MSDHEEPARGSVFAAQDGNDDEAILGLLLDAYAPLLRAANG